MASPIQWTWVWANSRRWWATEQHSAVHGATKSRTQLRDWITTTRRQESTIFKQKSILGVFLGGSVKNLPATAGDVCLIPDLGRFHVSEQLSRRSTTTEPVSKTWEPQLLSPRARACALQAEKPPQWEIHTPQLESSPHWPKLKKSTCSNEDPVDQKINK